MSTLKRKSYLNIGSLWSSTSISKVSDSIDEKLKATSRTRTYLNCGVKIKGIKEPDAEDAEDKYEGWLYKNTGKIEATK